MKMPSISDNNQRQQHTAVQPVLHQLRQYIVQQLPQVPRLTDAANTLNMSSRTLQRALHYAGSSFRQLVSQCRHQLAQQYLQDASLSLQHIAYQLGFEEQSSFQKAFKSWQGCSPGIFRQRRQAANSRCRHFSGLTTPVLQVNYGTN